MSLKETENPCCAGEEGEACCESENVAMETCCGETAKDDDSDRCC